MTVEIKVREEVDTFQCLKAYFTGNMRMDVELHHRVLKVWNAGRFSRSFGKIEICPWVSKGHAHKGMLVSTAVNRNKTRELGNKVI